MNETQTNLVTKEAFHKPHHEIKNDLLRRIEAMIHDDRLKLVNMGTSTGYKSFNETISLQVGEDSLCITLSTSTDTI